MSDYVIPSAFLVSLLLTLVFASLSGSGPWRAILIFFFIIFLISWAGQLWITPFGPSVLGVSLVPLLVVALIFSFLIIMLLPRPKKSEDKNNAMRAEAESFFAIGMFFWFLIIILVTSIVIGYYKIPPTVYGVK